jgi:hypothetical protein
MEGALSVGDDVRNCPRRSFVLVKRPTFDENADGHSSAMDHRDDFVIILRLDDEFSADGNNDVLAFVEYSETSFASYGEANPRRLEVRRERNEGSSVRGRRRYERDDRSAVRHRLCMVCEALECALEEEQDTNRLAAWFSIEINTTVNDRQHFVEGLQRKDRTRGTSGDPTCNGAGAIRTEPEMVVPPVDANAIENPELARAAHGHPNRCSDKIARERNVATPERNDARLPAWRQGNDCYARILACSGLRLNVITTAHFTSPLHQYESG